MNELQQKQLDFLEDTVKYYSEDTSRRAVTISGCYYYRTDDGRKCAIGRFIPDDLYNEKIEEHGIDEIFKYECIPNELKELGVKFLYDIQYLHDNDFNWENCGLSSEGEEWVYFIKNEIIKEYY
jgi:hypothetical protein